MGSSVRDVAERSGVAPSTVQAMTTKPVIKAHPTTRRALARVFGMTPAAFNEVLQAGLDGPEPASIHRVASGAIPVINKTSAGAAHDYQDVGRDNYDAIPITAEWVGDPDAFAVQVVGDSMEPEYLDGDIVVFAPAAEVREGDACFVQLDGGAAGGEGNTFKLVFRLADGRMELRPLNARRHKSTIVEAGVARVVRAVGRYQREQWRRKP